MTGRVDSGIRAANRHAERWGMVWFGMVFWGSVINAVAQHLAPGADAAAATWAAYATGLALGAVAKARGGWL